MKSHFGPLSRWLLGPGRPFHAPRTGARCLEWLLRPENGCLSRLLSTPHAPRTHKRAAAADGGPRTPWGAQAATSCGEAHLTQTPLLRGGSAQGWVLFAAAGRVHSCSTLHPHDYRPGGYLRACPLRVRGRAPARRPLSTPTHRRDLGVFCCIHTSHACTRGQALETPLHKPNCACAAAVHQHAGP